MLFPDLVFGSYSKRNNNRLLGVLWPLLLDMALHRSCMTVIDVECKCLSNAIFQRETGTQ